MQTTRVGCAVFLVLVPACAPNATGEPPRPDGGGDTGAVAIVDGSRADAGDAARPDGGPSDAARGTRVYHTTFPGTENPISEGGAWTHASLSRFSPCATSGGFVRGTSAVAGPSGTDDSYAFLSAATYPPVADQYARAVIHRGAGGAGPSGNFAEVELHLRASTDARTGEPMLYEVYLSMYGSYFTVARWNPGHTFTLLGDFGSVTAPADGDEFYAEIVGNVITVRLRGATVGSLDVANPPRHDRVGENGQMITNVWDHVVYATGSPGVGFDTDGNDSGGGFREFEAGTL
jgi:hypothetical protein